MDDGSKPNPYGYLLCTNSFSFESLNIIQEFFLEKFDIKVNIQASHQIYITASGKEKFKNLIEPYIIPSMKYKL